MKRKNDFKICKDYSTIYINKKDITLEVIVDTEDLDRILNVGKWHALKDPRQINSSYYMCNRPVGKPCIKMHRFIMDCPKGMVVDHINRNTLDNRKCNLRIVTQFENSQNQRTNKTGIVGVHYRARGYWVGSISKDNKKYSKEFKTKEEAIKYREEMYRKLYKEVM